LLLSHVIAEPVSRKSSSPCKDITFTRVSWCKLWTKHYPAVDMTCDVYYLFLSIYHGLLWHQLPVCVWLTVTPNGLNFCCGERRQQNL
jgi:hypothetical protein